MRKIFLLICFFIPIACGAHSLHIGDTEIPFHSTQYTTPSMHVQIGNEIVHAPAIPQNIPNSLHALKDNIVYSICNGQKIHVGHYWFIGACLVGADDNVYLKIQNDSTNGCANDIPTAITWANTDRINFTIGYRHTEPIPTGYENNIMFVAAPGPNKSYISFASNRFYSRDTIQPIMTNIEPNITCVEFKELPKQTFDIQYTSTDDREIRFGSWSDCYWSRTMNWYRVKIYSDNILLTDFIPVPAGLQIGNFTVPENGMWDIVEQKFYGTSGTGEFVYGVDE